VVFKVINKKIIKNNNGAVVHMYNKSDKILKKINEVYFSNISPKDIRAWKKTNSEQYLCVPKGQVLFALKNKRKFETIKLGYPSNYKVLYIKPNVWYGFMCVSKSKALICNMTSLDNDNAKKVKKNRNYFNFKWDQKH